MTETRDDLAPKPTDTKRIIEQIENCRTGLLREVLGTNANLSGMLKGHSACMIFELRVIKKLSLIHSITCGAISISIFAIAYALYQILEKLTALGL